MGGRQFRISAPAPQPDWLARPRLVQRLHRRFEVALTIVVAHAGYGKTSLLSQAVAETAQSKAGVDIWVQCDVHDATPEVLAAAIIEAGGQEPPGGEISPVAIADLLTWHAPEQACLILDDVHRIPADSRSWVFLDELLDLLPHNGHVVLSGRVNPAVTLARREVAGSVERIGLVDLEYNDDELQLLGASPEESPNDATRWPAVRALGGAAGSRPAQFLVEEVIAGWSQQRRTALSALAPLVSIDDRTAAAASNGSSADELLGDVPLVQHGSDGSYQLHDLWRDALMAESATPDIRNAMERIGKVLLADHRFVDSASMFQAADSVAGLAEAAEQLVATPYIMVAPDDLERMLQIANATLAESPIPDLVASAIAGRIGDERIALEGFERAARNAATTGSEVAEGLALQQAMNMRSIIDPEDVPSWLGERADVLLQRGVERARQVSVVARFHTAMAAGRPDEAATAITELVPPTSDRDVVTYTFGMTDLGRPEQIDVPGLSTGDLDVARGRIDLAVGVWLRGLVDPETALELGTPLVSGAAETGFAHIEVQANAVFSIIALAAGRNGDARRFADTAYARSSATASVPARGFAQLADALCVLVEHGEQEAAAAVEELLVRLPIRHWPPRPYLFALPTIYLLAPSVRPILDRCRFGPALGGALAAGRSLVALRDGDAGPAAALAWDRPDLLRAHVLPCHLGSLIAAVSAVGQQGVGPLLSALPHERVQLALATDLPHAATAQWAAARVAMLPPRPSYDLQIDVLGQLHLRRGDTEVVDAPWLHRQRVRQLLAYLVIHRRASRRDVAEALWPDHPVATGLSNLRVNLTHLQRILQPGRETDVPPWFLRSDTEWLWIADDGIEVDTEQFDDILHRARQLDASGRSREARAAYAEAVAIDHGDLLAEWPDVTWAEFERHRLRTGSVSARCRLGELLLAGGEPEEASRLAEGVLRVEPLQERAGRLLVHALAAQGDRATAFRALSGLAGRLREIGLEPEPDTVALARSYGLLVP